MSTKIIAFMLFIRSLFCSCGGEVKNSDFERNKIRYKVIKIGRLDKNIKECSGLQQWPAAKPGSLPVLLAHGDGGTGNQLFAVSGRGALLAVVPLPAAPNHDWEALARDTSGHIYVGDFGNNGHARRQLAIYKIALDTALRPTRTDTIAFAYPDQREFPPVSEAGRNFDCEAFFWHQGRLHLFSKNWGERRVKHYTLPDAPGRHLARLDSGRLWLNDMITAADISPDGRCFALLSYSKLYVFEMPDEGSIFAKPLLCRKFARVAQAEALTFIDNSRLLIGSENGKMFLATPK